MASITSRKNRDGSRRFDVQIYVQPFKRETRSFPTRKDATSWSRDRETQLRKLVKAQVRPDLTQLTLLDLGREYLADPETLALTTLSDQQQRLTWWLERYGSVRVLDFGVMQIREGREKCGREQPARGTNGSKRANATVNRYVSVMRSCWSWGQTAGLVPPDRPWPKRIMLTEPDARVRFLNATELEAVQTAARDPWMYATIIVSIATGLRQSELLRLTWDDVSFERATLAVSRSKNKGRRSVHLNAPAIEALKALRRTLIGPKWVFPQEDGTQADRWYLTHRWNKIRAATGLKDTFRWHDLRHTCASYQAAGGSNLLEIGQVLGHRSVSASARYAHLVEGQPMRGSGEVAKRLKRP